MSNSVSISPGNTKMGAIPSVSLPAGKTCPHDCPCFPDCYARRLCAMRPTMRNAYENNFEIWRDDPDSYFDAVRKAAAITRFFRWHVSGDMPNESYFENMVVIAQALPKTDFLCFTKRYGIVNAWVAAHGLPPRNLHLIFSAWRNYPMENPFSFPVCRVLYKDETPASGQQLCTGNCTACALTDCGCWTLQKGETICIPKH